MKQNNRIWIYTSLVAGLVLFLLNSCEEGENLPDYASNITGTYTGNVIVGVTIAPASSTLTKDSEQVVDLEISIGLNSIPLKNIKIINFENGIYNLQYSDRSGSFTGEVEGNKFTWTLKAGDILETFSGTK